MTNSIPAIPSNQETTKGTRSSVKVATPDLVLFQELPLPVDVLGIINFENIASQEIINIARSEIVNGQDVSYSLIGNLKTIQKKYNPENIFSLPDTINKYFRNFAIRFDIHVPEKGTGPNNDIVYLISEPSTTLDVGDLIIDVINMEKNERVDVEILRRGSIPSDTMYVEES